MYKKTYNSIGQITLRYYPAAADSFMASPSHSPPITLTLASYVILCIIARVRHWNEYSLLNNNIALYSGQKGSTLSNYLSKLFAGGEHYL